MSKTSCPRLIICTTCRMGQSLPEGSPTPGQLLHRALRQKIETAPEKSCVTLAEVSCLANCDRGCSGAIAMPGKWTYLLGGLSPDHAADLLVYGTAYAASVNGTVMPSRRPVSLRHVVMGRVPPLEFVA